MTGATERDGEDSMNADDPGADMPRWVRYLLIGLAIVVVFLLVTQFVGGGHGPGSHRAEAAPRAAS